MASRQKPEPSEQWIWGRHPVLEALHAGNIVRLLYATNIPDRSFLRVLHASAAAAGVSAEPVEVSRIESIATSQPAQGVVAQLRPIRLLGLDELLDRGKNQEFPPLYLILDQVQDPRNVGSLLRSAEAAGVDGVLLGEHRSSPLSGVVAKASAGALFHLRLALAGNLTGTLSKLGDLGIWSLGLTELAGSSIYEIDLSVPLAIVVGNEGSGIRKLTSRRVDMTASIPMRGHISSLNASVAGAIALFEANRQRIAAASRMR